MVAVGTDRLCIDLVNGIYKAIGVPELAVLFVDSNKVSSIKVHFQQRLLISCLLTQGLCHAQAHWVDCLAQDVRDVEEMIEQVRVWPPRGKCVTLSLMNARSRMHSVEDILARCAGFSVLRLGKSGKFDYWPKGDRPKTHAQEFLGVRVSGMFPSISTEDGLPNRLYTKD